MKDEEWRHSRMAKYPNIIRNNKHSLLSGFLKTPVIRRKKKPLGSWRYRAGVSAKKYYFQ